MGAEHRGDRGDRGDIVGAPELDPPLIPPPPVPAGPARGKEQPPARPPRPGWFERNAAPTPAATPEPPPPPPPRQLAVVPDLEPGPDATAEVEHLADAEGSTWMAPPRPIAWAPPPLGDRAPTDDAPTRRTRQHQRSRPAHAADPFETLQPLWLQHPNVVPDPVWYERSWAKRTAAVVGTLVAVGALIGALYAISRTNTGSSTEVAADAMPDEGTPSVGTASAADDPLVAPVAGEPDPTVPTTASATDQPSAPLPPTVGVSEAAMLKRVADAGIALNQLELVAAFAPATTYADYLADGWSDRDGDCISTRDEALAATSLDPVSWSPDGCVVESGRWLDAWAGSEITDVADAVVTHTVPPAHAHDAGGWRWERSVTTEFANDDRTGALHVVSQATAATVDATGVSVWQPPNEAARCSYALDWITVKTRWELQVTQTELDTLGPMIADCLAYSSAGPRPDQLTG